MAKPSAGDGHNGQGDRPVAPEREVGFVGRVRQEGDEAGRKKRTSLEILRKEKKEVGRAGRRKRTIDAAAEVIRTAAVKVQQTVHDQIASVVTRCLAAVFEADAPEFRIVFEKKRGKTQARLVFVQDGKEIDPQDGDAGGLLDVAAFALRLAALRLAVPRPRQLLVLDEPFKHLDKTRQPRAAELLMALATELNVQIVLVTHSDDLKIGTVIQF